MKAPANLCHRSLFEDEDDDEYEDDYPVGEPIRLLTPGF
jgi:hypothetical protein